MLKSIRILLSIAAQYDYEIWQMDVKIAFLNGHIREEIFMDQLEGFISHGQESSVQVDEIYIRPKASITQLEHPF